MRKSTTNGHVQKLFVCLHHIANVSYWGQTQDGQMDGCLKSVNFCRPLLLALFHNHFDVYPLVKFFNKTMEKIGKT